MAQPRDTAGKLVPVLAWGTAQSLAIGAASAQSAATAAAAQVLRLVATVDTYVALGTNPTATAASTLLPANCVEFVAIPFGVATKVAALQVGAAGNLSITECG